jgi:hypothetical protein
MLNETTWGLVAKKFCATLSSSEKKQLQQKLKAQPELHYPLQIIYEIWEQVPHPDERAHRAFVKQVDKLERQRKYGTQVQHEGKKRRYSKAIYWLLLFCFCLLLASILYSWFYHTNGQQVLKEKPSQSTFIGKKIHQSNIQTMV